MLRIWCGAALMAATLNGAALAQDDDASAHYTAYTAALAQGRVDDAIVAGDAAWRAAEAAWGDRADTAVFAYNIASLLVRRGRAADALEPARRALELAESDVGSDVDPLDAAIVLGLAEARQDRPRRGINRLKETLDARDVAGVEDDDLTIVAWYAVAQDAHSRRRWRDAVVAGRRARMEATAFGPSMIAIAANAALIEGAAAVVLDDFDEALFAFEGGLDAYPEGTCVLDDPMIARLMAWRAGASALAESSWSRREIAQRMNLHREPTEAEPDPDPDLCDQLLQASWSERTLPRFPMGEAVYGGVGGVIIAYDLAPDGSTTHVRALAAVPDADHAAFADVSVRAAEQWRLSLPEGLPEYCRVDRTTTLEFILQ